MDVGEGKESAVTVVVLLGQMIQLLSREILCRELWRIGSWMLQVPLVGNGAFLTRLHSMTKIKIQNSCLLQDIDAS